MLYRPNAETLLERQISEAVKVIPWLLLIALILWFSIGTEAGRQFWVTIAESFERTIACPYENKTACALWF